MTNLLKVIIESIRQAFQQLIGNKLRSFLSLLGITIGIFCVIGVKSAVDSLQENVISSFEELGNDILFINKFPWADASNDWWKWIRRPNPNFNDYKVLKRKMKGADMLAYRIVVGFKTLKYQSNSVNGAILIAATQEFGELFNLDYEKGRHFSISEYNSASPKVVLGSKVATELFGLIEPIGKKIKLQGRKVEVIGIIKKEGESLINVANFDEVVLITYPYGKNFANLNAKYILDGAVMVKAKEGIAMTDLKDEATGILRAHRRLKPVQESNFSINEMTMLTTMLNSVFSVLNLAGMFIGVFALLVGMFSVANIMFVSVKERTGIIGIKKALGAKRPVILLEFLIEAIILCIIGGIFGLIFIFLIVTLISSLIGFDIYLSIDNMVMGMTISIIVGILAGFIPALKASKMDPVEAMRA